MRAKIEQQEWKGKITSKNKETLLGITRRQRRVGTFAGSEAKRSTRVAPETRRGTKNKEEHPGIPKGEGSAAMEEQGEKEEEEA